ncbi:MAG TPA: CAP domain-containing protein [Solirubrobacteraceae bacterium]|nr:CAP domain-containing protein [Solirubrobacteraceae bacterium]
MAPRRTFPALAAAAVAAVLSLGAASPARAASCPGADIVPAAGNLAQVAEATHCLLNAERAARGLKPTRHNAQLAQAAAGFSRRMVAERFFGHVAPDGEELETRLVRSRYIAASDDAFAIGENLAWGQGELSTPRALVTAWMNSPGHRANVLHRGYAELGLGFVLGTPSDPSQGATVTAEYGTRPTVAATPRRSGRCAGARTARARAAKAKAARRTCAAKAARRARA